MSPDLERLVRLQHLETALAEARSRIASHPQRLADADARLNEARQTVEAARQRLKDGQEARRALEKEAALFQSRLSKFKDQLFEVKTNREYQAIQKEIEVAQSDLAGVEEKILERMIEADALSTEIKQAEATLADRQKEVDAEKARLAEELASADVTLKQSSDARAALLRELDPGLLSLFKQVAKQRKGVAICSATRDGLCSVCHVRLRPHVFQQVRRNDSIIQCESCRRILYYIPPPSPVEPAVTHTS